MTPAIARLEAAREPLTEAEYIDERDSVELSQSDAEQTLGRLLAELEKRSMAGLL